MALLKLDTHTGVQAAFNDASSAYGWDTFYSAQPIGGGTLFTNLSYDPVHDVVVVTRGHFIDYALKVGYHVLFAPTVGGGTWWPSTWQHVSYRAETLDPQGPLATAGASYHVYPVYGQAYGLCRDPNTGELRQSTADFFVTAEGTPETYGKVALVAHTIGRISVWQSFEITAVTAEIATDDVTIMDVGTPYQVTIHSLIWIMFGGYVGNVESGLGAHTTPNVLTFDDVAVFVFEDLYHQPLLSVIARGTKRWLGTRMLRLGHVMALCPVAPDRGLLIAWQTADATSPLLAVTFSYDRVQEQLVIDRVDTLLPAGHGYQPHVDIGMATYDTQRQAVILLNPDEDTLERYVTYNLCHPGRPTSAYAPVPLSAVHAGQTTTFALYTGLETNPAPAPTVYLSWGDASAGLFSAPAPQQTQTAENGTGTFSVNWTSAAEGAAVTPVAFVSSYSVVLSATTAYGTVYGVEPMTILAATNTFTVSAAVSASVSSFLTATTILPGRPALQSDAVGAGTPQELVYPTALLNSPLVFELNPQLWTNVAAELLTRPLYASQRTLTRTATVQFVGHYTDLEVKLTWMGGGDRAAMSWSFFSQLYNYFANPPDVLSTGYIRWRPKDLSNHVYDVLFTNLEVGGQGVIQLDTLAKAREGYVHDAVTATLRVVAEVQ